MLLTVNDLAFLSNQTRLDEVKLLSLLEEDEDLLLQVISTNETSDSISPISFPLFVKMCILRETENKKQFSPESKEYVTNSVTDVYPKIYNQSPYLIDKKRMGESEAQFYLVLTGLFPEFIQRLNSRGAPAPEYYIKAARIAFSHTHREEIAKHIFDWVRILNNIKRKYWNL